MLIRGTDLSSRQREQVLSAFPYRWTHEAGRRWYGGQCPACAQSPHPFKPGRNFTEAGKRGAAMSQAEWHAYHAPVVSDDEWVRQHAFNFNKDGTLGRGSAQPSYAAGGKRRSWAPRPRPVRGAHVRGGYGAGKRRKSSTSGAGLIAAAKALKQAWR